MGTEIGMRGGYGFQGQVTAMDGSDKQGKMGARYNNLRRKEKKQQCKMGREKEGSSSNQPELAAFFLALRDTLIEELVMYLCDNQSLLKAITRWIGEGGKAPLVGSPDVDIWQQPSRYYERGLQLHSGENKRTIGRPQVN